MAWDETIPTKNSPARDIDVYIRDGVKKEVRAIMGDEHQFYSDPSAEVDNGHHKTGSARVGVGAYASAPAVDSDNPGHMYVATDKKQILVDDGNSLFCAGMYGLVSITLNGYDDTMPYSKPSMIGLVPFVLTTGQSCILRNERHFCASTGIVAEIAVRNSWTYLGGSGSTLFSGTSHAEVNNGLDTVLANTPGNYVIYVYITAKYQGGDMYYHDIVQFDFQIVT